MSTSAQTETIAHSRQERLRYLESALLWQGVVKRKQLCDAFGVSPNHVTKDVRLYDEQHPHHIEFQPRLHGYVAGSKFRPVYASDDPREYLSLLQARSESGTRTLSSVLNADAVPCDSLPSPALGINREILRAITHAVHLGCGVDVDYHSMSAGETTRRTLWPHALMHTGMRWHVRAYDSKRLAFRDFALQRIGSAHLARNKKAALSAADDESWHRRETLDVIPHPELNDKQKTFIAHEFNMAKEGESYIWHLTLRRCLIGYFAQRYGLDAPTSASHVTHHIVLRNREELKKYFIGEASR